MGPIGRLGGGGRAGPQPNCTYTALSVIIKPSAQSL